MRRPVVEWFEPSIEPSPEAIVVFEYGAGPTLGTYHRGKFIAMKTPACQWPRCRINRWRYCTSPDQTVAVDTQLAA